MLKTLQARIGQGHRTITFPTDGDTLPDRFRGFHKIDDARCSEGCRDCAESCPTGAITIDKKVRLDLGKCLFCVGCVDECPERAIVYTREFRMAVRRREDLEMNGKALELAKSLEEKTRKLFGRSLKLRQVSAAGCNGCESDVNVLNTVVFDLGRFGIQFVASPRHADGLLITGPVSKNMELALKLTYEAVPDPKLVIAVGACAISGGPFIDHPEILNGAGSVVPIDLFIPGCPPHPMTILDGLLRLLGKV